MTAETDRLTTKGQLTLLYDQLAHMHQDRQPMPDTEWQGMWMPNATAGRDPLQSHP